MLIDATHPFAAQISANAASAAAAAGVPFVALRRPAWVPIPGDRWIDVPNLADAASTLPNVIGPTPGQVFLAIGRQELAPFRGLAHHFVIRSVEPPATTDLPPNTTIITARGPFLEENERTLFQHYNVMCLIVKNSGGITGAKLAAARALSLPVIMVARPEKPPAPVVADVAGALAWIHRQRNPRTDRGV